jgi:pimeloyl-ACP methyl ester carboxylesterase
MSRLQTKSGFVNSGNARLYYETAGQGIALVMIHAGVADSRQWNNEFAAFARHYQVVRYDMRGYGKSEPVGGEFNHMDDLVAVLNALNLQEPVVIMGCSMGGGLAMDFALTHPSRTRALIMVGSAPSGLELDVPAPAKFAEVEKAFEAGDLDLVSELETQVWFDGTGRTPEQVDQAMRKLLYEMNRQALAHEMKQLGKRLPNTQVPAFDRLSALEIPVLIVIGEHDTPYILAAADYMIERVQSVEKVIIKDAAHLPNMDHPEEFQSHITRFLEGLSS